MGSNAGTRQVHIYHLRFGLRLIAIALKKEYGSLTAELIQSLGTSPSSSTGLITSSLKLKKY